MKLTIQLFNINAAILISAVWNSSLQDKQEIITNLKDLTINDLTWLYELKITKKLAHQMLLGIFAWSETPQGHGYWSNIHTYLGRPDLKINKL